jgi:hypothetical protein
MMKKIVGILVCMLLIITTLSATGATNVQTLRHVTEKNDLNPYQNTPTKSPGIINIKIVGKITKVLDPQNLLEGVIQVNDSITGKYTYDSGEPDSDPDPHKGEYEYNSPTFGIELEAGGLVFKTNPNDVDFSITILNNYYYNWDHYSLSSNNNLQLSNGLFIYYIIWQLIDQTGNVFSNDALPTTAPVLSDWSENTIYIDGYNPSIYDTYHIKAEVTKVTLSRSKARDDYFTTQPILIWLFERFPNLFPILQHLLD